MARGRFIVLEGGEGAGKSTLLPGIKAQLEGAGKQTLLTREPGGTDLGEALRALLIDPSHSAMDPVAELLLMFAARKQHLAERIEPALRDGVWVVSDRFVDSSYAYQGGGRGLPMELIADLERLSLGDFHPDLSILLDLDPELGLSRARCVSLDLGLVPSERGDQGCAGSEGDRFEREGPAFFKAAREVFLTRARASKKHRVVDASAPLADVERQVSALIAELLEDA